MNEPYRPAVAAGPVHREAAPASVRQQPRWRDHRRYLWVLGLAVPLGPFVAWLLVETLHWGVFWAAGVLLMGVIVPLVDVVFGVSRRSPPDAAIEWLERDPFYRWCTYLYLPLQYAGLVFACYEWVHAPMGVPERIALAGTVGVVAGVGINAAHEMGHKRTDLERRLAKVALAQSFYGHFYTEHNHGHHIRVATPHDPASARFGEGFWRFLPRSVFGSVVSGWRLERDRLRRRGRSVWSPRNNVLNAWAMSVVLFAVLIAVFGWQVAPYLALQALIGILMLEAANYLEHYGLLRGTREDGRGYVRSSALDSWNSDHVVSNLFLYQLQRHSDHHDRPAKRYQSLVSRPEAPQLPAGYAVMIWCALFPPVWRRVMHQRLVGYYGGDVRRTNLDPKTREQMLNRYLPVR